MDSLANLRAIPKHDWKVRVRVSRCWRRTMGDAQVSDMGFVVVDENGSRMLGWIRTSLMFWFEHEFVEGRVIDIVNFVVRPYTEFHRNICFVDDKYMFLTSITTITPVEAIVPNFPMHVFGCTPLNNIRYYNMQETYLIDVLGFVQNVEAMRRFINKNGVEQCFHKFDLTSDDASFVTVKLWNTLATSFWEMIEGRGEQAMIVLLSSCKVIFHEGIPSVTDVSCTRFYVNPILPQPTILPNGIEKFIVG
ncbi:hypothetical protein ACET3Z_021359 [Daucus carota]